jgi:hypothetical protein
MRLSAPGLRLTASRLRLAQPGRLKPTGSARALAQVTAPGMLLLALCPRDGAVGGGPGAGGHCGSTGILNCQDRGARHSAPDQGIRILARAWIRLIYRCWLDGVPYDPVQYGAAVRSPNKRLSKSQPEVDTGSVMRHPGRVSRVAAGWPSGCSGVRLASCRGSNGLQAWRRGPDQRAGTASRPDASLYAAAS